MSQQIGYLAACEAIEHQQLMTPLLNTLLQSRMTTTGAQMLGGFLYAVCDAVDKLQAARIELPVARPQAKEIVKALPYARRLTVSALCQDVNQHGADTLGELLSGLHSVRARLRIERPKASVASSEAPPSPVMLVQIVGMPGRETETVFTRDNDFEITQTRAVERDKQLY